MQLLRSLKLNCWLAALLPTSLAIAGLFWWHMASSAMLRRQGQAWAVEIVDAAAGRFDRGQLDCATWLQEHPAWSCCAELNLDDDAQIIVLSRAGEDAQLLIDAPPLELSEAVQASRSWQDDRLRAATLLHDAQGQPRALLYIEREALPQPGWQAVLITAAIALGAGILMAWYLARRIYRPIVAIHSEAESALRGDPGSGAMISSPETDAFASSVCDLARMVRNSRNPDSMASRPDSGEEKSGASPSKNQE